MLDKNKTILGSMICINAAFFVLATTGCAAHTPVEVQVVIPLSSSEATAVQAGRPMGLRLLSLDPGPGTDLKQARVYMADSCYPNSPEFVGSLTFPLGQRHGEYLLVASSALQQINRHNPSVQSIIVTVKPVRYGEVLQKTKASLGSAQIFIQQEGR